MKSFGDSIYTGNTNIDEAGMGQSNQFENMVKFINKYKPKTRERKAKKQNTFDSVNALYEGRELTLNHFRSRIFPIKATQGKGRPRMLPLRPLDVAKRVKILTSKQTLQRLPIALAQVKQIIHLKTY